MNITSAKKITFHCQLIFRDLKFQSDHYWKENRKWIIGTLLSFPLIILPLPFLAASTAINSRQVIAIPTIIILSLIATSISFIFSKTTRQHFHCQNIRALPLPWHYWLLVKSIYYGRLYFVFLLINTLAILSLPAMKPANGFFVPAFVILSNTVCTLIIGDWIARYQAKWITGFLSITVSSLLIFREEYIVLIAVMACIIIIPKIEKNLKSIVTLNILIKEQIISIALVLAIWFILIAEKIQHLTTITSIILITLALHGASQAIAFSKRYKSNFIFMPYGEKTLGKISRNAIFIYMMFSLLIAFFDIVLSNFSPLNIFIMSSSVVFGLISFLLLSNYVIFIQGALIFLYLLASFS